MLLFAALGPVIALASLADAARSTRVASRRARAEHSTAIAALADRVARQQREERRAAWQRHPSACDAFFAADEDARRWRSSAVGPVVLGTGSVACPALAEDGQELLAPDDAIGRERAEVVAAARTADDMPVVVDASAGVGVVGPEPLVRAVLRGLVLQLVDAVPPRALRVSAPGTPEWEWAAVLPHSMRDPVASTDSAMVESGGDMPSLVVLQASDTGRAPAAPARVDADGRARSVVLAGAPTVAVLPPGCGTILVVRSAVDAEIVRSSGGTGARLVPELVSREQAGAHAGILALLARRTAGASVPATVSFAALEQRGGAGLHCMIGIGAAGPVAMDLVADGPHAVVGGTTGSGKSELLVTWMAAMAAGRRPSEFAFLLVDFKGGATGTALGRLPHCVGVVTDLDAPLARRVLESLRAEMRRREAVLAAAGVSGIDALVSGADGDAAALPRLVIVVDELAALLEAEAGMHALFADIAARGRSLGLHLILCTQRPAGVVREALLANCALRISLRLIDGADSAALISTPAAARIPAALPGRCLIARRGSVEETQLAVTTHGDIEGLAPDAGQRRPWRPWLPPLPAVLGTDHPAFLAAMAREAPSRPGVVIGLLDRPALQDQPVARWPGRALIVQGSAGSGRTALLSRIAAETPGAVVVPADVEETWDALERAEHARDGMLLLDDWDAVTTRWELEYRQAATERLTVLLHDGAVRVVVAARRASGLGSLTGLFGGAIVLRTDDRSEHALAGAPAELWDPDAPPGRGVWQGARLQVLAPDGQPHAGAAPNAAVERPLAAAKPPILATGGPLLAVSSRPEQLAGRLARLAPGREILQLHAGARGDLEVRAGPAEPVLVGRPDAWQAQPVLFTTLCARSTVVFDGCSTSEVRQLTRLRELPPPLRPGAGRVWVLGTGGGIRRARIEE